MSGFQPNSNVVLTLKQHHSNLKTMLKQRHPIIVMLKFGQKPDAETMLKQHQDSDVEIWLETWHSDVGICLKTGHWNKVETTSGFRRWNLVGNLTLKQCQDSDIRIWSKTWHWNNVRILTLGFAQTWHWKNVEITSGFLHWNLVENLMLEQRWNNVVNLTTRKQPNINQIPTNFAGWVGSWSCIIQNIGHCNGECSVDTNWCMNCRFRLRTCAKICSELTCNSNTI